MIKIKNLLKEDISRQEVQQISQKLLNGQDCTSYLLTKGIPSSVYKRILKAKNTNPQIVNKRGQILYYTYKYYNLQILSLLLAHHRVDANRKIHTLENLTLLHMACTTPDEQLLKVLLKSPKVNVNLKTGQGLSPIRLSIDKNLQILKILLNHPKIDVNAKDNMYNTVLQYSAWVGNIQSMKLLLNHPKIDVNDTDNQGDSVLHDVSRWGNVQMIELLLSKPGINTDLKNNKGYTPFQLVSKHDINYEEIKNLFQGYKK